MNIYDCTIYDRTIEGNGFQFVKLVCACRTPRSVRCAHTPMRMRVHVLWNRATVVILVSDKEHNMGIHTDPQGKRWQKTSGYNGYIKQADGSMVFDVHTGTGRRTVWEQVVEPPTCPVCGEYLPSDFHAELNHRADCGVPLD